MKEKPIAWLSKCYNEDGDEIGYTAWSRPVYQSFPVYDKKTLIKLIEEKLK